MRILVLFVLGLIAWTASAPRDLSIEEPQNDGRNVAKKGELLNRNFERMLQLVNILGQVDTFLSERLKLLLRKLALLAEDDDFFAKKRKNY